MEEKIFYEDGVNKVTSSRFIAGGTTHAMNGITSVKQRVVDYEAGSKRNAIIAIAIGASILIGGFGVIEAMAIGAVLIGVGIWMIKSSPDAYSIYHIITASASGETEALSSRDASLISKIEAALNDSIITRG